MKCFSIVCLILFGALCNAQTVSRTFLPVNPNQEKVKVLANEQSTFLIKTKADQSIEVIAFDETLQELWGIGISLKFPVLHVAEVYPDEVALFLSDTKRKNFVLLEIDAETGHYFFSEYTLSTAFQGVQLARNQEQFWVKGWIGEEPVAFRLNAATQTLKTLPLGHASPVNAVVYFGFDEVNQELDVLLETTEKGLQAYLLRSINRKGEITRNQLFNHLTKNVVELHFKKNLNGNIAAIGTLAKKKMVLGLAFFSKDASGQSMKEWDLKGLPGLEDTWTLENQNLTQKQSKPVKSIEATIDEVFFSPSGEIIISLETFEKDYEVRGLMQRESDEQSMIDQIDLNRYGRRDFDVNESTLSDRADNFSNTEASTYRFRDVIIDRVQEQGNRHSRTTIIKISEAGPSGLHMKVPKTVNSSFSMTSENLSSQSYWVADEQGIRHVKLSETPTLINHNMNLGPYLKRIGPDAFLNFGFLLNDKVFYLMLQRIGFDANSN